jgi:hypothetical protein
LPGKAERIGRIKKKKKKKKKEKKNAIAMCCSADYKRNIRNQRYQSRKSRLEGQNDAVTASVFDI